MTKSSYDGISATPAASKPPRPTYSATSTRASSSTFAPAISHSHSTLPRPVPGVLFEESSLFTSTLLQDREDLPEDGSIESDMSVTTDDSHSDTESDHSSEDSSYDPSSDDVLGADIEMAEDRRNYGQTKGEWYDDPKLIVHKSSLHELVRWCCKCAGETVYTCDKPNGACVTYRIFCQKCKHTRVWHSSPKVGNQFVLNVLLAMAIVLTGCLPTAFSRALTFIGVRIGTVTTFFNLQNQYVYGIIEDIWRKDMEDARTLSVQRGEIHAAGDARHDSPGHSALYGLYSIMDTATHKIIASAIVKATEVGSSQAIEKEALRRCMNDLTDAGITLTSLTTDGHTGTAAYMRTEHKETKHYLDAWHISKNLRKKLTALCSKRVAYKKALSDWIPGIINHLYVVITKFPEEKRIACWKSCFFHICNEHEFPNDPEFPKCLHRPYGEREPGPALEDGRVPGRPWLKKASEVAVKLQGILHSNALFKYIKQAGQDNTSSLECFHSLVNRYATKQTGFRQDGLAARLHAAALYQNENGLREAKIGPSGDPVRRRIRDKGSSRMLVRLEREDPTFDYKDKIFLSLEKHLRQGTKPTYEKAKGPTRTSLCPDNNLSMSQLVAREESKRRGIKIKPIHL